MSEPVIAESSKKASETAKTVIRIGGRKSDLAVIQSKIVAAKLSAAFPDYSFPVTALNTLGDNVQTKALYSFGGKSLWTKELEILLMEPVDNYEQLDMVVHSLKDVPTVLPDEFELGAIIEREDPRDALIMKKGSPYKGLADLPNEAYVGTSSIRRAAQLKKQHPNLQYESIRGNIQTRLAKLDNPDLLFDAIILAAAGLKRAGLEDRITTYLDSPEMYYAVGQGALGIEIRKGDKRIKELLKKISHIPTTLRCLAERSLLLTLEGGCSVPIGVETVYNEETKVLKLSGTVVSVDGKKSVFGVLEKEVNTENDAEELGSELAKKLIDDGAKEILDEINMDNMTNTIK